MILNDAESDSLKEDRDTTKVCNLRERPLLLRVNGILYDIALFASKHPGGQKVSSFRFFISILKYFRH